MLLTAHLDSTSIGDPEARAPGADDNGSGVPGVTVTVANQETGAARTAYTDSLGGYNVPALASGVYSVTVTDSQ